MSFCHQEPLAAIHLVLDFGHDTDPAAQPIGALAGAVHGASIFPLEVQSTVAKRLKIEYGEDINVWVDLLVELGDRKKYKTPIRLE